MPAARTISLRMHARDKEIIGYAAEFFCKSRTSFVVDCALEKDREILYEKTHFVLTPEQWEDFVKPLDNPPKDNPGLDRLMNTIPPWDHK